jgi:hypothetical protein
MDLPSYRKESGKITGEFEGSWFGPQAATESRKPVGQSKLAQLKRKRQRLEDKRHELLDEEMKLQARIDELEAEKAQAGWGDDSEDEYVDEPDVAGIFDDDADDEAAEPAVEFNPQTKAAIDAMSPEQRDMFLGGAG